MCLASINKSKDVNMVTTLSTTSLQRRSILVFRVLGPVKKLPRFSPRKKTMKSLTDTFSPPLSARTLDGTPHSFLDR